MPRKKKRPTLTVGSIKARALRGPKGQGLYYWQARWTSEGERQTTTLGWLTKEDAEQEAGRLLADGLPEGTDQEEVRTVRHLLRLWGRTQENRTLANSTLANYRRGVRRLTAAMGDVDLRRLDIDTLESYRDKGGYSAGVVVNDMTLFRQAWEWGRQRNHTPNRALPKVKVRRPSTGYKPTPTWDEAYAVVQWLWKNAPAGVALGVHIQFATGCRISEAARVELADVDLVGGWIWLGRHADGAKTGERRWPLADDLAELIRVHGAEQGPVTGYSPWTFHSLVQSPKTYKKADGTKVTTQSWLRRACEGAEVPHFTSHALRRLMDDRLYSSGIDPKVAADLQGHSPQEAMQRYRQPRDLELQAAALKAWSRPKRQVLHAPFGD